MSEIKIGCAIYRDETATIPEGPIGDKRIQQLLGRINAIHRLCINRRDKCKGEDCLIKPLVGASPELLRQYVDLMREEQKSQAV